MPVHIASKFCETMPPSSNPNRILHCNGFRAVMIRPPKPSAMIRGPWSSICFAGRWAKTRSGKRFRIFTENDCLRQRPGVTCKRYSSPVPNARWRTFLINGCFAKAHPSFSWKQFDPDRPATPGR